MGVVGPQFVAGEFKEFIRQCGMTHVRTSPYYPQSNGKLERWHFSVKNEAVRPASPTTLQEAIRIVSAYVEHYNGVRLHSALDYIAPLDYMNGRATQIWAERDRRLEQARQLRAQRRALLRAAASPSQSAPSERACA